MLRRLANMCLKRQAALSLTLAFALLLGIVSPAVAFAEDITPGYVLVRGTVTDNHGDPMSGRTVTFTLLDLATGVESSTRQVTTNAAGQYQFPLFYIAGYYATHDICLRSGGDPVRYAAQDGELVCDLIIVNHGTINISFVDDDDNPVGAGVPFWILSKRPDFADPTWPEGYALDGELERTTNASGIISVFADKAYVYQYDQSGDKRYIWDYPTGFSLTPDPGETKNVTVTITPLGKVSFEACYADSGELAAGLQFSYPSTGSGRRFLVDEGDGRLSFYYPPGEAWVSGTMAGDPLTGNMGYTLPETRITVTPWGETSASGALVQRAPGQVYGTIYSLPTYDYVEGATVQLCWKPSGSDDPPTVLDETTTDTDGEFLFNNVVPSEIPYTIRAFKNSVGGAFNSTRTTEVSSGSGSSVDFYVTMVVDTTPPAMPTGLVVTDPADATGLTLSWNANTEADFDSYSVYRSTTETGEYAAIATGLTNNSYKDSSAVVGQEYWYKVTASDEVGNESEASSPASGTLTGAVIAFSNATFSATENTSVTINLVRTGSTSTEVSVTCSTQDGSAVAGQDYVAKSDTVMFAAGQTDATFVVELVDDAAIEGEETFTVQLSAPGSGAILGTPSTATATIVDNDSALPETPPTDPEDDPEPDYEPEPEPEPARPEGLTGTSQPEADVYLSNPEAGIALTIPAGATETTVEFSVETVSGDEAATLLGDANVPDGFTVVGPVFHFSAKKADGSEPVTAFNEPVVFEFELSQEDLAAITDPRKVGLYRLNDDGTLTFVGGEIVDGRLVVRMHRFSHYVVIERSITFDDVQGHWAQDDVELMASRWVVLGRDTGLFDPTALVSRAEFAAMLVRAMLLQPAVGEPGFTDVTASDSFYEEIATAAKSGLVRGYSDGDFRPNAPVTREEACVMLARAMRLETPDLASPDVAQVLARFADTDEVSAWARGDVAACAEVGIVRGRDEDSLAPQDSLTRAEAAAMIARFWKR